MATTAILNFDRAFVTDVAALADALRKIGDEAAASLALLPAEALEPLLAEARGLPYRRARPLVGQGDTAVYQDFNLTTEIPADGALMALSRELNRLIGAALASMRSSPLPGGFGSADRL